MTIPEMIRFVIDEATRFFSPITVAAEWALSIVGIALLAYIPAGRFRWLVAVRDAFKRLAQHKSFCIVLCGALPVLARLCLLGVAPVPEPSIHDEFSHLLLADTLAHGRLTNPTHPMWRHFETIHVIQQPTYASMYPPAQGTFLALGQVVFHEPWAGVLIAVGLMFAAMCWMMQGWLLPEWALYGTLIAIVKIGIAGIWVDSYLPAAVPAIGGALVVGALPRLRREHFSRRASLLLGIGAVILMQSRPVEGGVLCFVALIYGLFGLIRDFKWDLRQWKAALLPAGAVLALGLCFTGYYSYRVTGNVVHLPYQVNRDTYGWPENLGILPAKKLVLPDPTLQDMYVREITHRDIYRSVDMFLDNLALRLFDNWTVLIGPLLTFPLLCIPWVFGDPKTRPLVVFLGMAGFLNLFQMVLYPYHLAATVPVIYAIVTEGLRSIRGAVGRLNNSRALGFAALLPCCLLLIATMKQQADTLKLPLAYWERATEPHRKARASLLDWLNHRQAKQLVIVHYNPGHPPSQEWVYNRAKIDRSKTIWARDKGTEENAKLLAYYPDREVWLLKADEYPQRVVWYPRVDLYPRKEQVTSAQLTSARPKP